MWRRDDRRPALTDVEDTEGERFKSGLDFYDVQRVSVIHATRIKNMDKGFIMAGKSDPYAKAILGYQIPIRNCAEARY